MAQPARYRPFRLALWIAFFAVALTFVGLVVFAVVRGVMAERQLAANDTSLPSDPAACAQSLAELYRAVHAELDRQRAEVSADDGAVAANWAALRARLNALGARCKLQSGAADPLSRAYACVVAVQRLAESAAVQYRHEVGPTDLEAQKLLQQAGAKL